MSRMLHVWPSDASPLGSDLNDVVTLDLRCYRADRGDDLIAGVTDLAVFLVRSFADLSAGTPAVALVVRHNPAPSGRLSGSLFGEIAVSAARGFLRQLRYDRMWIDRTVLFVDARDATDAEVAPLVGAALNGDTRVELERSSGRAAAYGWERGHGL